MWSFLFALPLCCLFVCFSLFLFFFFFFNDTATTEIYTLSLHDALPILFLGANAMYRQVRFEPSAVGVDRHMVNYRSRSEEHTSELQSRRDLVCRLLLEKKKKNTKIQTQIQVITQKYYNHN